MPVLFREKSVGQHGANIFYKEFSVLTNSNYKTYCLGSFCFVQKPPYPVTIAEFQLIWKNTYTNKKYACVKLYFDPEDEEDDDDDGYMEEFGKDEVIEANRQVVIECCELPYWECSPKLWNKNIGQPAFADVCKEYIKRLIKKEHVITQAREDMDVKIISYPQYCRYMACMKMIKIGVPMTFKVFIARGGLQLDNINTIILFSRGKFTKLRIDEFSLTRNITIPVFKGRPRKKKRKELMLLKKRKQKKLLREVKKWKLESRKKRKYNKRSHKDTTTTQDSHSSVNSAASRIINKYKKKNEKTTELATKKETVVMGLETAKKKSKYYYSKKKGRKPNDGRLMINKLKKAALLNNMEAKKEDASNEIGNKKERNNKKNDNIESEDDKTEDNNESEDNKKGDNNMEENMKKDVKRKEYTKKKDEIKKICTNKKVILINSNKEKCNLESIVVEKNVVLDPNNMHSKESSREEFTKELYATMEASGKPIIKVPSMGKAQVDLYELYTLVTQYGGYSQVTMKREWREIYDGLGRHSNDITNAATSVRKIYENLLLLYENKKRKKDSLVQEKCEKNNTCKSENEIPIGADNSSKCKEKIADCKPKPSKEGKQRSTENRVKSYKKSKEKRVLVNNSPLRCEYKRINTVEQCINESIPITYVTCENNTSKHFPNGNESHIPHSQSTQNHILNPQNEGTTSFTLQAGEAFKLMIQKRRGRPSKDFREQIEQLKTLNRKVEVKVFPPVGKRTRLPKWLNELNVDIVNPRRKRRFAATGDDYVKSNSTRRYVRSKIEIPPLSKEEIPQVSHISVVNNSEARPSTSSVLKIDTPSMSKRGNLPKLPNSFPEILPKSTNEYVSMVAISPEEKTLNHLEINERSKQRENERCEFVIQSVQSLAKSPVKYPQPGKVKSYAHYPSAHPITIPQSVLSFNEYRPKYASSISSRIRGPPPQYPVSSSRSSSELTSQTYRKEDLLRGDITSLPINDIETKGPNLRSFGCKITGPNIRQICIQNNKKRIYTSDHRLSRADFKKDNIHMEKIYIHRPPHLPHNSNTGHKPITHIPLTQNISLIPAQTDLKFSGSHLTFHNYIPPSDVYISPSSMIHKNKISDPLLENHQTLEPKPPKVYILPEEYPVVPRTSV